MRNVADVRIHGTTGEPPIERFEREERSALRPLAAKVAGVNYLDRPATTILAGWRRGTISL
jgi:hypothetical protein